MFLSISRCPHCKAILKSGINEPKPDPLGKPGYFLCPFCLKPINLGAKEWFDFSLFEKMWYFIRIIVTVIISAVLSTVLVLMFFIIIKYNISDENIKYVFLILLFPWAIIWYYSTKDSIHESSERKKNI
jgi:hypothetical protein